MIKTVKKKSIYDTSSIDPSNKSYLKAANQASSRIRRRTILGEKFDYGEKIKEKQNYVLYVAGQGQEKKEIEEIEELGTNIDKKERIVEQKQIIDNYQYHETKEIKKKHSRNSQTQHKRLCDPFERTTVKKYSSYTSEPKKGGYKIIRTTNIVDKNDYSRDYLHNNKNNRIYLNSWTTQPHRSQDSRRIESNSNLSNSSSNNDNTYKIAAKSTNITQVNNKNKRKMSNNGRISNYSQYERKKVNGMEKVESYTINQEKNKSNLLPQNTIKYTLDKDSSTIPKPQNYKYNRIKIDISKYNYTSNPRKNSSKMTSQNNHEIKYDSQPREERSLYEGPKYQLIGKDIPKDKPRPQTVSQSRNRSNRVRKQSQKKSNINISNEKKGYIPFGGKGYRVGGDPVQIPKPNNKYKIPKPTEERYSSIHTERNSSYTEITQRSSSGNGNNSNSFNTLSTNSNVRSMKDLRRKTNISSNPNIRRNNQRIPKNKTRVRKNPVNKFPGKGIRVGSSGINRSELISENNNNIAYAEYKKFEKDNMDMLEIPGKNNEIIKCFEQSLFYQGEQNGMDNNYERRCEENLCFRDENEVMFKEIFCPVHGRQVISIGDLSNMM